MRWTPVLVLSLATLGACKRQQDEPVERPAAVAPAQPAPPPAPPPAAVEEAPSAPDPRDTISGTVTLPSARKKNVGSGDTIYVVARRAGGPPGPASMLAVQRLQVGDFPLRFTISGRDAMVPGTPFVGPVDLTVRVDKDGDALTRKKGEIFGQVNGIKVGTQDVAIPLDSVQAEDVILGGGMRPGSGTPPAGGQRPSLPPGHP